MRFRGKYCTFMWKKYFACTVPSKLSFPDVIGLFLSQTEIDILHAGLVGAVPSLVCISYSIVSLIF